MWAAHVRARRWWERATAFDGKKGCVAGGQYVSQRFLDKTAIITGASSGIGAATARLFAAEGARVVLAARSEEALHAVASQIGGPQAALAVPTDVTDAGAAAALLERSERQFGAVHVLVNNAGWNSRGAVEGQPVEDLARIIDVNLKAPIRLSRLALPYLRRAGGGAIVNVASLAGRIPLSQEAAYSASKFGLRAFSLALAEEVRGSGITVSVVSPGPVDTDFIMAHIDEIPDLVFSQPMSTASRVASLILACVLDGKEERALPRLSGYLCTLGYLFPKLARTLKPLWEWRGRAAKQRYRRR